MPSPGIWFSSGPAAVLPARGAPALHAPPAAGGLAGILLPTACPSPSPCPALHRAPLPLFLAFGTNRATPSSTGHRAHRPGLIQRAPTVGPGVPPHRPQPLLERACPATWHSPGGISFHFNTCALPGPPLSTLSRDRQGPCWVEPGQADPADFARLLSTCLSPPSRQEDSPWPSCQQSPSIFLWVFIA